MNICDFDIYYNKLSSITSNSFEKKLLKASIDLLKQENNPLKINNFSSSVRELLRHILNSLAPDEEVTKCDWFQWQENERGKKIVTRKSRIKYAIQKNFPSKYITKNFNELDDFINDIYDIYERLNKYTHIEEKYFNMPIEEEQNAIKYILNVLCAFCDKIKEVKTSLDNEIYEHVRTKLSSSFFMESIDKIDCLSTHTTPDDLEVCDIKFIDESFENILVRVTGNAYVHLQYGSDHDCDRDNGFETDDSFPFESDVKIIIDDDFPNNAEILSFDVNTDSFYE